MEMYLPRCYTVGHETSRNPAGIGAATPTRNRVARGGRELVVGGPRRGILGEFGAPMVSELSGRGRQRIVCAPGAGAPAETLGSPAQAPGGAAAARSTGRRIRARTVDAEARGASDRAGIRRDVSPLPCLAALGEDRLELPEARAAGPRAQRRGDRTLAHGALAPYKKTHVDRAGALFFWMKPASCSSRWCVGRGRPRATRRFTSRGTAMTRGRVLPFSPFPPPPHP